MGSGISKGIDIRDKKGNVEPDPVSPSISVTVKVFRVDLKPVREKVDEVVVISVNRADGNEVRKDSRRNAQDKGTATAIA